MSPRNNESVQITAIIPTLNEESQIARCVESAWGARCDEVIVADGGSSDRTVDIVSGLDCRLVRSAAGRARQQNAAADSAVGDVLLFLHADNWLAGKAADQIRAAVLNEGVMCGAFRQRIEAAGACFRLLELGNAERVRWLGLPYGDQGIFVLRQLFQQVGGFPVSPLLEDLMIMSRIRKIAWPRLLPGPLHVHARRWRQYGVVRQTLRNWLLLAAYRLGASPERLAAYYATHGRRAENP